MRIPCGSLAKTGGPFASPDAYAVLRYVKSHKQRLPQFAVIEKGLVESEADGYFLGDPFFARYIRN